MATDLVRNLFDQYQQRENRLTHALVQTLAQNKALTREFVRFATGTVLPPFHDLSVSCQLAPGDSPEKLATEAAPDASVPDAWVFSDQGDWALVCECKLGAGLEEKQLRRHIQLARKRGFDQISLLALTSHEEQPACVQECAQRESGVVVSWRSWREIYRWFVRHSTDLFARELVDYLSVLEGQMMANGSEVALTAFEGIDFEPAKPYRESEAKVRLRSLMRELRPKMHDLFHVDSSAGRGSITGGDVVWDIVRLTKPTTSFTEHPHFTVCIGHDAAWIELTLPSNAKGGYWSRLRGCGKERLTDALSAVMKSVEPRRRLLGHGIWEPRLVWCMQQVHFYGRRKGIIDGNIEFDFETVLPIRTAPTSGVKMMPAWLDALYALLAQKNRPNCEITLQARFPYVDGSSCRNRGLVDEMVYCADAFRPFLDILMPSRSAV